MAKTRRRTETWKKHPSLPESSWELAKPGIFTQEGRLLQVEWARKCPSGGYLAIAMKTIDGLLLAKGKAVKKAELGRQIPSIWRLSQSLAFVATGNIGDMFCIYDKLMKENIQTFNEVSRRIRNILHEHTVSMVKRPLALFILLAGFDDGMQKIADIDVLGSETQCDAWAIGHEADEARKFLTKYWNPNLNQKSGLQLIKKIYGLSPMETYLLPKPVSK